MVVTPQAKTKPGKPNEAWSMGFLPDQLANGMKFRTLTIVTSSTRQHWRSKWVSVCEANMGCRVKSTGRTGPPQYLFVDNGAEFSGQLLDLWAYHHKTRIDFSRPGKPTANCHIETFNGSFRRVS